MRSVCIFTLLCGAFEGLYKTFGGTTNKGKKKKKRHFSLFTRDQDGKGYANICSAI